MGPGTTESQTHREMASGLSMPVGFKNSTDGTLTAAINALQAAKAPQSFLGIDGDGYSSIVKARGNPWGHIVLRGGERPNYDPVSINNARTELAKKALQMPSWWTVPTTIAARNSRVRALSGRAPSTSAWKATTPSSALCWKATYGKETRNATAICHLLQYGVSITDECISWETTEDLLMLGNKKLFINRIGQGRVKG